MLSISVKDTLADKGVQPSDEPLKKFKRRGPRFIGSRVTLKTRTSMMLTSHCGTSQGEITAPKELLSKTTTEIAEDESSQANYRGPLNGIPMAIKDNIYLGGEVTTIASQIHGDYGSNGGSGAAVTADMSFATLGKDTAGPIRIPSAACGVAGLKPAYGRVAKYACFPLAWSLDHIGQMFNSTAHNAVRKKNDQPVNQGALLKTVRIPSLRLSEWVELTTSLSGSSAIHHTDVQNRPGNFGSDVRFLFDLGELLSSVEHLWAQQIRCKIKQEYTATLQEVDVIITPTLPVKALDIASTVARLNGQDDDFIDVFSRDTGTSNLTGLPALTVPVGLSVGLPNGLLSIGRAFDEAGVLKVGSEIERTNPMAGRRAPVSA